MLQHTSDISSQGSYRYSSYQVDDDITPYQTYEMLPLIAGINGLNNSSEERVEHSISLAADESKDESKDVSAKAKYSWLKRLLNVVAVLTGVGVIAAGGFYLFGRMNANYSSNNATLNHFDNTSATLNNFKWNSSSIQFNHSQFPIDSNQIPETSNFPYQDIYRDTVGRNKTLDFTPAMVAKNPSMATPDQDISVKPLTARTKNSERNNYSNALTKKNDRPLGAEFHRDLAAFCLTHVHSTVFKAYRATPVIKCNLLDEITTKINLYKKIDTLLREIDYQREPLTNVDYSEETLSRRKVTMLYLAAETIINGKDKDITNFYNLAMNDYKNYSSEELITREKNIMDYFVTHSILGTC